MTVTRIRLNGRTTVRRTLNDLDHVEVTHGDQQVIFEVGPHGVLSAAELGGALLASARRQSTE